MLNKSCRTYVLIKARVVEVDGFRPGIVVPDIISIHIKPSRKYPFLESEMSLGVRMRNVCHLESIVLRRHIQKLIHEYDRGYT